LIKQNEEEIYNLMMKENGHVYLCGDSKVMNVDVTNTFKEILSKYQNEDPEVILSNWKKEKRFQSDIWS
jgi:sulfite reductase alpha subunit-like flavoprotein